MRTPGADRDLAAGFLLAERVLTSADDLGTIQYCTDPSLVGTTSAGVEASRENVINVTLANGSADRLERLLAGRRRVTTNASCGMCGRLTIESLRIEAPAITSTLQVSRSKLTEMPERLRAAQGIFDQTGGLHAAGLFTAGGELLQSAEDVGRHNAVDKVVGRMLIGDALPLPNNLLVVSGRVSFEIVQKALLAGIPIIAAVSAPSTLAIDLAVEAGVTLLGFVRGNCFNVYTHPTRIGE
jgi:FdhD protein